MSKEVKRYDATRYEALRDAAKKATPGPWRMEDDEDSAAGAMYIRQDTPDWREPIARLYGWHDQNYLEVADPTTILELLAERDALLAERDALLRQVDTLTEWYSNSLDVINDITAALPGTQYMDPPDGGDVSVPEQVRRMAKDAERTRMRVKELDLLFGRYLLAMKAAVIDADQRGDEEGMRWIYNSLAGPGELPAEDEIDAQAFFDREIKSINDGMAEVMAYHRAALQGAQP